MAKTVSDVLCFIAAQPMAAAADGADQWEAAAMRLRPISGRGRREDPDAAKTFLQVEANFNFRSELRANNSI